MRVGVVHMARNGFVTITMRESNDEASPPDAATCRPNAPLAPIASAAAESAGAIAPICTVSSMRYCALGTISWWFANPEYPSWVASRSLSGIAPSLFVCVSLPLPCVVAAVPPPSDVVTEPAYFATSAEASSFEALTSVDMSSPPFAERACRSAARASAMRFARSISARPPIECAYQSRYACWASGECRNAGCSLLIGSTPSAPAESPPNRPENRSMICRAALPAPVCSRAAASVSIAAFTFCIFPLRFGSVVLSAFVCSIACCWNCAAAPTSPPASVSRCAV